nr:hypothetical protein [Micromonospora sp. DSM 115978]
AMAAGLREEEVLIVSSTSFVREQDWNLVRDIEDIEVLVKEQHLSVLVVDPFTNFVNKFTDPEAMRYLMKLLTRLANKTGVVIFLLNHMNKSTDQTASKRGTGAQPISQASRFLYQVGQDPKTPDEVFVLANSKSNLGPKP